MSQIKIFRSATGKSILDVRSALNYYQKNKSNEDEYKGSVIFTINEYGHSGEQAQAFLPKARTKMLLDLIRQHQFFNIFPNGYTSYGGSIKTKRARILTIRFDRQKLRYIIQIADGIGRPTKTGAMKMVKQEKSVMTFISYEKTLELAHEVLDFISQAELMAMFNGKPLYTIMNSRTTKQK